MQHKPDLLGFFAHHKVAGNLLMLIMILGGMFALQKLNIRYFPNFDLDLIQVSVSWKGASAEDIETAITIPLEQSLKTIDNLRNITSTSTQGSANITLELFEGTDTIQALNQVKQYVDEFRNLPDEAEIPKVISIVRYEQVAKLLIYGAENLAELRTLANNFEQQLLQRGIDKVDINGLPDQEIAIEISHNALHQLGISLNQVVQRIRSLSQDIPAGTFGADDTATELRSLNQRRDEFSFARLPIITDDNSRIELGSIAEIKRQAIPGGVTLSMAGKPAVELVVRRSEFGDSFQAAEILKQWIEATRPLLPNSIKLHVYDETWQLIDERISLLFKNGATGLVLVVTILYLFLSTRVALWVAVGIPVSFMATLLILHFAGGSINMISLFALIMALGIIVDDAIVVGEDALTHYQAGEEALLAAEGGARRMFAPVFAASLTTIAAFLPLMLIRGPTGKILFEIPLVIVAVIIASLIESFFVLPSHLRHSFLHMHGAEKPNLQQRFNQRFTQFKKQQFKQFISLALEYRAIALSLIICALIICLGLLAGGRLKFSFFPSPEASTLYANVSFVPGTPRQEVYRYLQHVEQALHQADQQLAEESLVLTAVTRYGTSTSKNGRANTSGDHLGAMTVELIDSDQRQIRTADFIKAWRQQIKSAPGIDTLTITSRSVGPPGRDIGLRLSGNSADQLKLAALEIKQALKAIPGVSDIEDDMPYGRKQLIYTLTPAGEALGLTVTELGKQLHTAFTGERVQIFQDGPDEIEVRVKLPQLQRDTLSALEHMEIRLDSGLTVPLHNVASWQPRRGFDLLRHDDGVLALEVSADVDRKVNNANQIIARLKNTVLPELALKYSINYTFAGQSADQAETMSDMGYGLIIGLTLIYFVLAWIFASYGWPLIVMAAIPFGLIGALFGHLILGIDITILSLFGLFGLSGIVVNDSIILVSFYQQLRTKGMNTRDALIEASCQRLRAVLLTSMTTIAGLTPLLFETSLQAQFLVPMAASIAFGLMFSTVLVLMIIPVLLSFHEDIQLFFSSWRQKLLLAKGRQ